MFPLGGVAALVLGCVVCFPLAWETNRTKATAQTIASESDGGVPDERGIDAIRRNLVDTLQAVHELKAEPSAAVRRPPTRVLLRPRYHSVPADVAKLKDQPIGSLTTNIGCSTGALPTDWARQEFDREANVPPDAFEDRNWSGSMYEWEAPGLCHKPLYFEEVNLERYGYTHRRNLCFQPVISGGRFVGTIAALPYMMTLRSPRERVYTLGHYRPGSCVPFQVRLIELDLKAAAVEAAVVTGLIFAIP